MMERKKPKKKHERKTTLELWQIKGTIQKNAHAAKPTIVCYGYYQNMVAAILWKKRSHRTYSIELQAMATGVVAIEIATSDLNEKLDE